jgi:tetratricopeptide (TPR) repeat protein
VADAVPGLPAPLASDPETERYRLFDAVAVWLGAASADEPLVVVLDDLQWAAKPTLLLLRHVARSPEPRRVLILGTYRDSELSHGHPLVEVLADLRRQSDVERISITGLGSSAVAAFMEQAAGHTIGDEELALARAIHEETEGNPFFVREVLRHLNETGRFEQRDGRWSTRLPVDEIGIPESIREVIGRRLSRLSEASNGVLRTAAVVGAEFDAGVVEAAGTFDEETILSALDEAAKARLVIEQAPVGNRYRFAHALVRDTIYDELSATRRIALHRRVAEAIETVHAGAVDDHLPALAHHWARASAPAADTARAVDYAVRAGDRALAQLAHDEAASYYRQAIELLGAVENDEAEGRRVALLIALGEAERRAGDPRHRQTLLDAATAARARGDSDTLARAALANHRGTLWSVVGMVDLDRVGVLEAALDAIGDGDSPTRARLLANLALELIWAGDRPRRVRLSDEALAMARRLGDPATLAYVLANRAYAIAAPATLQERLRESAELVALSDEVGDPLLASRAWAVRFRPALEAGDTAEADRCLAAFERLASELNQPTLSWVVGLHQVGRTLLAGDIGTAERMAEDVFELGRSTGQLDATTYLGYQQTRIRYEQGRMGEVTGGIAELLARVPGIQLLWSLLALAWCQVGELDRAREAFEQVAANGFASLGFDSTWLQGMTDAAAVCAHLGDTERARVLWEVLEPYSGQVPVVAFSLATGTVDHYLGLLATTLGDFDEAESRFVAAEAVHARIGAPTWLARTRLEWARMLLIRRRPGDAERARPLLEEVLETARRLGLAAVERGAVGLRQEGG